ncbi:ROK family protein [Actinacidiphila sp. DG2A-62]|uniref:ROK family transcriptional regulator n=1 Tax=Actinacidiphila sp. DG2A-62 TaxID=3108821 RepID=UPI002DBF316E|nr:ROK family protein [Actinacidiphila sp. DG2A-62]MEC3994384.1 ROK family protein [Actinacidiphila sp. DG2A-62]
MHPSASGANLPALRDHNAALVLDLLRAAARAGGGLSRAGLAERTGLTPQAISKITARLRAEGLVEDSGHRAPTGGKPRAGLRLAAGARYAVGAHLDGVRLTAVVSDLAGRPVADLAVPLDLGRPVDEALAAIADGIREAAALAPGPVLGAGVGVRGPLDHRTGVLHRVTGFPHWQGCPLRAELTRRLGLPVAVDKNTNAAALALLAAPADPERPASDARRPPGGTDEPARGPGRSAGDPSADGPGGSAGDPSADGPGGSAGGPSVGDPGGSAGGPSAGGPGRSAGDPSAGGPGRSAGGPSAGDPGGSAGGPGPAGAGPDRRDAPGPAASGVDAPAEAADAPGHRGRAESFAYLHLGTGLGAALVLEGAVYRGGRTGAGEFGHQAVQLDGPLCKCGNRGCLEALCLAAADRGDTAGAARLLGVGAANLVALLDIDRVVLGGGGVRAAPRAYRAGVAAVLAERGRSVPVDVAPPRAVAEGAALLVLQPFFTAGPFR